MRLRITIDLFSGRPNPSWTVTDPDQVADLVQAFTDSPAALADPGAGYDQLGFRGIDVEILDEPQPETHPGALDRAVPSLPQRFRVAGGGSRDEAAASILAERILASMPDRLNASSSGQPSGPELLLDSSTLRQLVHDELTRRKEAGQHGTT